MEAFSALLAICAGNSSVNGESPSQRPVTGSFDVLFDLRLNERRSKQSWGWWFETPSRPLWRHSNVVPDFIHNFDHYIIIRYGDARQTIQKSKLRNTLIRHIICHHVQTVKYLCCQIQQNELFRETWFQRKFSLSMSNSNWMSVLQSTWASCNICRLFCVVCVVWVVCAKTVDRAMNTINIYQSISVYAVQGMDIISIQ